MENKLLPALALCLAAAACSGEKEAPATSQPPKAVETNAPKTTDDAKPAPKPVAEIDPVSLGKRRFSQCAVCHSVKEGDASRVGPNLFGIYGKAAASVDGFAYSKAMREAEIVWDDERLDAFLANPPSYIRGNRMAYVGERKPENRAALIAYLKTLK